MNMDLPGTVEYALESFLLRSVLSVPVVQTVFEGGRRTVLLAWIGREHKEPKRKPQSLKAVFRLDEESASEDKK
ncbi:MAG: hypothetical protein KKD00_11545 [Gammaproteobacteria bacterium]|nr:hypothetical protein [Gammaproteobacteria bacterium]